MRYEDTIDESKEYLRIALSKMGKLGLPFNPLNYIIWYEYASGKNIQLNETIDNYLKSNDVFTQKLSEQIYNQLIVGKKETVNNLVREGLENVFSEAIYAFNATSQAYSETENKLGKINDSLEPGLPPAKVEMIVQQINQEIEQIQSTNSSFKNQLEQSTSEIDQLKEKLDRYREEAFKDPLTKIDNRRGFDKRMDFAVENADADATSLCLIIADIDHFKKINDAHGHLVGDNVIRMVANTMKTSIKGKDSVARIGGEEFTIILPDTPYDGAVKLAEDIRIAFERLDLKKKNTGESIGKITISFGVTKYQFGEATDTFFNRADQALYNSKNTGRNKVTAFPPPTDNSTTSNEG